MVQSSAIDFTYGFQLESMMKEGSGSTEDSVVNVDTQESDKYEVRLTFLFPRWKKNDRELLSCNITACPYLKKKEEGACK